MSGTALIAIDWGTTSARSYCLDDQGRVLDQRHLPLGISKIQDGQFVAAFAQLVAGWDDRVPCLACGMIGSRQGWVEAAYVACPASLEELARRLARAGNNALSIVPGLITRDARGIPDVMRGEETQILGAVKPSESAVAVLPGTHTKWARVERGVVVDFLTFMTGELYALLLAHSILGRLARPELPEAFPEAFERGARHGLEAGSLSHDLFMARTLALTSELLPAEVAPWLSGLLIGREVRDALPWASHQAAGSPLRIAGEASLCDRYVQVLQMAGIPTERSPADAAALGLWRIAGQAGMLHG